MSKSSVFRLTPSPQTRPPVPKPVLDESRIGDCVYPHYPWHEWERWAIAQGLDADLAVLGHLTIREAYNHAWDERLKSLCGWRDDGQALLAYALGCPKAARRQWNILLRTDGLRGDYRPRSTEWTWGYLRPDAQRLRRLLLIP
jgi:hypothetical protein